MKKAPHQFVLPGLLTLGLCAVSLALGYALSDEMTGRSAPTDYVILTYAQAKKDLEDLQRVMRSGTLSPSEFVQKIQEIASRSKAVSQKQGHPDDHVIDITGLDLPTLKK